MAKVKENQDYMVSNNGTTIVLDNNAKYNEYRNRLRIRKKEVAELEAMKKEVKKVSVLENEIEELKTLVMSLVPKSSPKKKTTSKSKKGEDK